jgi:hypothetical protein
LLQIGSLSQAVLCQPKNPYPCRFSERQKKSRDPGRSLKTLKDSMMPNHRKQNAESAILGV